MIDRLLASILRASGIVRRAREQYVAGADLDAALARILRLSQAGYLACVSYLQIARDEHDARTNLRMYQRLIHLARISQLQATVNISFSQLGFAFDRAFAQELLRELLVHAVQNDSLVWLDTSRLVDSQSNVEAAIQLNRIPGVRGHIGLALRADLYRTKHDIDCAVQEGLVVRLHSSAGSADKSPTIQGTSNIRSHYSRLAEGLLTSGVYCSLATRDSLLIRRVKRIAADRNLSSTSFEFQLPDGVQVPHPLLTGPWRVRLLVPFGPDSADYVTKRLLGQ